MQRWCRYLALVGLLGCFLPFWALDDGSTWTWWSARHGAPWLVYSVIAAFAICALVARRDRRAWPVTIAFGYNVAMLVRMLTGLPWLSYGAWLMLFSAIGGAVASFSKPGAR